MVGITSYPGSSGSRLILVVFLMLTVSIRNCVSPNEVDSTFSRGAEPRRVFR